MRKKKFKFIIIVFINYFYSWSLWLALLAMHCWSSFTVHCLRPGAVCSSFVAITNVKISCSASRDITEKVEKGFTGHDLPKGASSDHLTLHEKDLSLQ